MKKTILLFLFSLSCISAQVDIKGIYSSSFYSFESAADNESRLNQYHGLNFKVNPVDNSSIYFKGNIKAIYDRDPQKWREKVYNAYLSWQTALYNTNIRVGRQFVYAGVVNGTLDAVALSSKPTDKLNLKFIGGVVAQDERKLLIRHWDTGNVLGGFGSYNINQMAKINASYFQKQRDNALYWQQLGTTLSGTVSDVIYVLRYDHNLLNSDYQTILANAFYTYNDWSFSGEVSSHKPKVYEDSFFSIFELKAHNQIRIAARYKINEYEIGLQSISTLFVESESNQHIIATLGNNWGVAGVVYQTGFGGENLGLYADVRYQMYPNLRLNLQSSHYMYERQSVQLEEEATSFSAGVKYNPLKSLALNMQIQQSMNSYYESDLRGLLKLAYSFNY